MIDKNRYIIYWLDICCFFIVLMIVIGGITRLTQSGLSMVEWKPITGIFPPLNENQWQESFEKYKQFPEYKKNTQFEPMDISQYKSIYFWEYIHRMLGRIIGLLLICPFIFFYLKNYMNNKLIIRSVMFIFIVIFQGILGWYMVKSGLVNNPHVSHFRLSAHLLLAFFLLAYIFWTRISINSRPRDNVNYNHLRHINILLVLFVIQVVFGAFIAGTKAGKLWNTFPLIEGYLFHPQLLSLEPLYMNFLNNMMMFQFVHRLLGIVIVVYGVYFFVLTSNEIYSKYTRFLFMVILIQFYLGIMTLLSRVEIQFAILHQFIAIAFLFILVKIKYLISYVDVID